MTDLTQAEYKICLECGHSKPIDEFTKDSKNLDGKSLKCKTCLNAYQRERYHLRNSSKLTLVKENTMIPAEERVSNDSGKRRVNRLSLMENWKLCDFIVKKYTESHLTEAEFAALATKELGFHVDRDLVSNRREEFNIPPNFTGRTKANPQYGAEIFRRLQALEDRLALLEMKTQRQA